MKPLRQSHNGCPCCAPCGCSPVRPSARPNCSSQSSSRPAPGPCHSPQSEHLKTEIFILKDIQVYHDQVPPGCNPPRSRHHACTVGNCDGRHLNFKKIFKKNLNSPMATETGPWVATAICKRSWIFRSFLVPHFQFLFIPFRQINKSSIRGTNIVWLEKTFSAGLQLKSEWKACLIPTLAL